MAYIVRYRKRVSTQEVVGMNYPLGDRDGYLSTELVTLGDGYTYVSIPDNAIIPAQPEGIVVENVELTDALNDEIKAKSVHVQRIDERVVENIRKMYTASDEHKYVVELLNHSLSRVVLDERQHARCNEYLTYRDKCVAWGREQKALLGLYS